MSPGGAPIATINVGNVTTIAVTAPAVGVYYVRVVALPAGTASNEVQVVVSSLVAPPAAADASCPGVPQRHGASSSPGRPAAAAARRSGYRLRVGTTPGGAELGVIPTGADRPGGRRRARPAPTTWASPR